ncbi:MAG TPA: hypothetical protein VN753_09630 [Terracidiphilus sp.]|nr:hypothetical protein [Terracidiphilus sp.]
MSSPDAQKEFLEYAKSFTDAEWEDAEATAQVAHVLCGKLTPDAEARFVLAAMKRKKANPSATGGEMLDAGLVALGKPPLPDKPTTAKKKARGKLAGAGV